MVGERAVRVGAYVTPGSKLLAVVPLAQAYVVANFQETQLTNVQPGRDVQVRVDTFGGELLTGRVESIAPATGVTFASVKPDNATGNFTKVVQRIPVKIVLEPGQPMAERLRVGMSVEARIDTASGKVNEVVQRWVFSTNIDPCGELAPASSAQRSRIFRPLRSPAGAGSLATRRWPSQGSVCF